MPKRAIGLPDPEEYGELSSIRKGAILDLITQLHNAKRAGLHTDLRLGDVNKGLYSWAVRKGLPKDKSKHLAVQQPLHEYSYKDFEGTIPEGYGAGEVKLDLVGKALITSTSPHHISFVTAHNKYPQSFRLQHTKDNNWILINTTPTDKTKYDKMHYVSVDSKDVEKVFSPSNLVMGKIDGAAAIVNILGDKLESLSYRTSKEGKPIHYTYKTDLYKTRLKDKLKDTVLRGELYGVKEGKPISAAELGGLLNATIENSIKKQKENKINLKYALFDIYKSQGKDVTNLPYRERRGLLQDVVSKLPKDKFELVEGEVDPIKQRELFNRVMEGRDPLTTEGIVAFPLDRGKPVKVKSYPEYDVLSTGSFPGEGKYKGSIGGLTYALPEDPTVTVGRVGSGLSDADREDILKNPDEWLNRVIKIKAQEQFPSKAYRAPIFISRHEDY
jgi:bifunctional non-homologous end joining protein LigD